MNFNIGKDWKIILQDEFEKEYFKKIVSFLEEEKNQKKIVYPTEENVFNAFNKCSFEKISVVILGQDPYHGIAQAHGLSFSVQFPTLPPPSLKNIFKELLSDMQVPIPNHGNLEKWAAQGVLLLNTYLTVRANEPMSHAKIGWEIFTNKVIKKISSEKENIVFILWGKFAQTKRELIDEKKHLLLESAHPSPLSAYNGFWGCKHFSKTNIYLKEKKKKIINWQI